MGGHCRSKSVTVKDKVGKNIVASNDPGIGGGNLQQDFSQERINY